MRQSRADAAESYPADIEDCHALIDYYRAVLRQIAARPSVLADPAWAMASDATTGLAGTWWGDDYRRWGVPVEAGR
jgi:hypothetical protein